MLRKILPVTLTTESKKYLKNLGMGTSLWIFLRIIWRRSVHEKVLRPLEDDKREPGFQQLPGQLIIHRTQEGRDEIILRLVLPPDRTEPLECDVLRVPRGEAGKYVHPSSISIS
jgi:hypothetical protein